MTNDVSSPKVLTAIRRLYKENATAQALFDWVASRQRDASSTTITRLSSQLGISRGEAVVLARQLETAGCGDYVVGRRGSKSRFEWAFSCISLGQAAAGEDDELEEVANPVPDSEEEAGEDGEAIAAPAGAVTDAVVAHLTIARAKQGLALSLGVPITNIEIIIRS